jgi:hypothetical protein
MHDERLTGMIVNNLHLRSREKKQGAAASWAAPLLACR